MTDMSFSNIKLVPLIVNSLIEIDAQQVKRFFDAAHRNDVSLVEELLDSGLPVDIDDKIGYTALMHAADSSNTGVVRLLLQKGAGVNKQNHYGDTALHCAVNGNKTDVMEVLLKHGASTDIKDCDGDTPIDLAREWNNKEAIRLLETLIKCTIAYIISV